MLCQNVIQRTFKGQNCRLVRMGTVLEMTNRAIIMEFVFSTLPNNKILDWSKFKALSDNKISVTYIKE